MFASPLLAALRAPRLPHRSKRSVAAVHKKEGSERQQAGKGSVSSKRLEHARTGYVVVGVTVSPYAVDAQHCRPRVSFGCLLMGRLLLWHEDQMGVNNKSEHFIMFFRKGSKFSLVNRFIRKSEHWHELRDQ